MSITVYPPRDLRPAVEHKGDEPQMAVFVFLGVFAYAKRRGNWVTNDLALSPALRYELDKMVKTHLQGSGYFTGVASGRAKTDFLLTVDLLHLYGTQYHSQSVVAGGGPDNYSSSVESVSYGIYGNAVFRYRLYDQRRGASRLFWERIVHGTAQQPPSGPSMARYGVAARAATEDALTKMTAAVTEAIDRYAPPPFDREAFAEQLEKERAAGNLVFLVQRLSSDRTAAEVLTIHHNTGRILGHRIVKASKLSFGRPLEWMLSRTRPDGTRMSELEYASMARFLAREYDLRRVDDFYRYHFCGKKKKGQAGGAPSALMSEPPRFPVPRFRRPQ